ncbi:transcriptional regulator [Pedobacter cryoconitis]|uniref:Transcriptional regulator n=1 Tax=Pedobacter cryoconitis TaxID=188932 RepID=A0A127VDK6_9SPHI|nr:response regulator transcription factor [Pedobacter cryoconitis]AMP99270.1 transcriptional regulator [Pedobacter cryoconitis]
MKILLIEDEVKLAGFIKMALEQAGYVTDHETDGTTGLQSAMINNYDLILLDLMLPSQNGFDILKNLRSFDNHVPVIMLSALGSTDQIIKGLDAGANDYLKKPFEMQELLARVRVLQRQQTPKSNAKVKVNDLEIDLHTRQVKRHEKQINLSNREFLLLEYLMLNPDKVITKAQMLDKVWNMNFDPGSNIIEVHLYQLRKKINEGFEHQHIQTVINRGYTLKTIV